jgi:DUF4097 and DUF4098 domain-containing protein YvlB
MKLLQRKQWAITAIFTTLLILIAATFSLSVHAKTLQQTFSATPGGGLQIKTDVGKINVITHDDPSIVVIVEIEGQDQDDFSVEFIPKNGNLQIIGDRNNSNSNWGWNKQLRVSFNITVPNKYNVQLNTSGGSLSIANLIGNIDIHTSGGSIELGNITGNVQAKTSGGTIKAGNILGNVLLYTSGGSIKVGEVLGELSAKTSGGSIKATFAQQITRNAELKTSGGSIEAILPPQIQINLTASTSGGRVSSDFLVNGEISKRKIEGKINGGGPTLILHTSGGSVKILKSNKINNLM